jgi:hypothetical protein
MKADGLQILSSHNLRLTSFTYLPKTNILPISVHWTATLKMGRAVIADAFGVEHHQVRSLPTLSSWRTGIFPSPITDRGRPNAGFCFCRY